MGKKKLIVLVTMVGILFTTVIASNAEQDKRRKFSNSTHQDIYSKNNFRPRRLSYNQQERSTCDRQWYAFPVRDNFFQLVPIKVLVKFKVPVSDFEAAYLFDHYQLKKSCGMKMTDNPFLIMFPEDRRTEPPFHAFERNPYVESSDSNGLFHLQKRPDDFGHFSREKPRRAHAKSRFPEGQYKEEIQHEDIFRATNQVFTASNPGRSAVKKDKGIPLYPGTDNDTKKIQISDPKRIIRSKAKIHTYRDSEGRIVFTNYGRSKSKTKK